MNSGMAELASMLPKSELIAPNKVKYIADDILEAYKARMTMTALANNG